MLSGTVLKNAVDYEHEAATRIQAHFRARRARTNTHQHARRASAAEDAAQAAREASFKPKAARSGDLRSSRGSDSSAQIRTSRSSRDIRKAISKASFVTRDDYETVVTSLLERPSRWPRRTQRWRVVTYLLLEEPRSSGFAQVLSTAILVCIIVSISCFMLETMPELNGIPHDVWVTTEVVCTVAFTWEYVVRLLVCDVIGTTVWKFVRTPTNLVDLFAILPFYLWLGFSHIEITKALGILRTVRLVRLFRIFKLGRYSSGLQLMIVAMKNSSQALWVLSFFLGIGVVLFSSAIYYVEKMGCPDRTELAGRALGGGRGGTQLDDYVSECRKRPSRINEYGICCNEHDSPLDFPTIIEAFWWSIVTMTTVGFGDVRPRTVLGKLVGTATMLSGILLIALPIAIIGRKFQEAYTTTMERQNPGGDEQGQPQFQSEQGQLTTAEMGRRLKLMRLPDSALSSLAREMADDLEEVGSMQKEIISMQAYEQTKQLRAVKHFAEVVEQLYSLSKPTESSQAKFVASAFHPGPRNGSRSRSPKRSLVQSGTYRSSRSSFRQQRSLSDLKDSTSSASPPPYSVGGASSSGCVPDAGSPPPPVENVGG